MNPNCLNPIKQPIHPFNRNFIPKTAHMLSLLHICIVTKCFKLFAKKKKKKKVNYPDCFASFFISFWFFCFWMFASATKQHLRFGTVHFRTGLQSNESEMRIRLVGSQEKADRVQAIAKRRGLQTVWFFLQRHTHNNWQDFTTLATIFWKRSSNNSLLDWSKVGRGQIFAWVLRKRPSPSQFCKYCLRSSKFEPFWTYPMLPFSSNIPNSDDLCQVSFLHPRRSLLSQLLTELVPTSWYTAYWGELLQIHDTLLVFLFAMRWQRH